MDTPVKIIFEVVLPVSSIPPSNYAKIVNHVFKPNDSWIFQEYMNAKNKNEVIHLRDDNYLWLWARDCENGPIFGITTNFEVIEITRKNNYREFSRLVAFEEPNVRGPVGCQEVQIPPIINTNQQVVDKWGNFFRENLTRFLSRIVDKYMLNELVRHPFDHEDVIRALVLHGDLHPNKDVEEMTALVTSLRQPGLVGEFPASSPQVYY